MTKLEKTTHVLLIAVCIVSLTVLVKHGLLNTSGPENDVDGFAKSLAGQSEASVPVAVWKTQNLVLLLSSHCRFCDASVPLYQKLSALHRERKSFSLLAVGGETPSSLLEYLHRNDIDVDSVLQVKSGFAGVGFTPAVFIVDSHGKIQKAFLGKLPSADEARLLRLVSALKPIT